MLETGLAEALAAPALNLRQGRVREAPAMPRRARLWRDASPLTRLALAAISTLLVQIATIFVLHLLRRSAREPKSAALAQGGAPASGAGASFGAVATLLFEAIRSTPNAELVRLDYRADGSLAASLQVDNAGDASPRCAPAPRRAGSGSRPGAANGRDADLVARLS